MSREDDRNEALSQILELTLLLNDDMTRSLARQGLTTSRTHMLWELQQRGPTTQRVLAEAMGVSARNVTGLVDALVATGFVTREPHPTDRRATLVSFTAHGAQVAGALEQGRRDLAHMLFGEMPDDRFDCFTAGLRDILARLRTAVAAQQAETQPAEAQQEDTQQEKEGAS